MDLFDIRKKLSLGIPLSNMKLRVTDYSRVSTNHLEQKKSLQNQTEHFTKLIKDNPNWTYVKGYIDDGISGTIDFKRDNFMQMIDDARNDKFDLIITKEISRFSRNTLDSIKYTRELLSYGVAVLFLNDNINTALPDSELRLTIMASMAQDEIRRLSERVKFGMNRAIERGEILGNNTLYGYIKDKKSKSLKIIPKEAKVVERIYYLYAIEKRSLTEIEKLLKKYDIKTCLNKDFSVTTLMRMLKNPKYKGYYCAKKSEVVDYMTKKVKYFSEEKWYLYEDKKRIPPIVDEYLWNLANKRINKHHKKIVGKAKSESENLYSAKILCQVHNVPFHRRLFCKATNDISWLCSKYLKEGKKVCDTPNIRESELNNIFTDIIKKLGIDFQDVKKILQETYQKNSLHADLSTIIESKINNSSKIIIKNILKKINASKNVLKNSIELKIFLNYSNNEKNIVYFFSKKYSFHRGYNTRSTKRYKVIYFVDCYL